MTFSFDLEDDGTLSLESAVFQALGAASTCWEGVPYGVFLEDRAKEIAEALLARFKADTELLSDALYTAWGIIANAHEGDWDKALPEWTAAAVRWRDESFHPLLDKHVISKPKEVEG